MIANVLNRVRSDIQKTLQNNSWVSMNMKYECEAGYIWSILGKLG